MKTKISIADFKFTFAGYGHYKVTYTSPQSGKSWSATTDDMPLIDKTYHEEYPKVKDLEQLKRVCKNYER